MLDRKAAAAKGDESEANFHGQRVKLFTEQVLMMR
jgi:hypothetical protein